MAFGSTIPAWRWQGSLLASLLILIGLGGAGEARADAGAADINGRPVSIDRLAAFRSKDLLVFRPLASPISVPSANFVSVQGPVRMPVVFRGHWTLLYVGYTFCPDVCPTELTTLSGLLPALKKSLPEVHWQVVFLSVDPERDHPKRLAEYAHYFDPAFLGITGPRVMIDRVTRPLKAGYRIQPHAPGSMTYDIDHDTAYRLISPDGKMVAIMPPPHAVAPMNRALVRFFKEVVQ